MKTTMMIGIMTMSLHTQYCHMTMVPFTISFHDNVIEEYSLERAEDWLTADDPAMFSDEFSGPEDWGYH